MVARKREDILKRSREMERHRHKRRRLALAITLVVFIGVVLIAVNLNSFAIKSVLVRGAESIPSGDIELLAREGTRGSYLYLVPRASIFFYPRAQLLSAISTLSPRVASARMHVTTRRILVIDITERAPRYVWCGTAHASSTEAKDENGCLYLDIAGFAFAHAFNAKGLPYPIFIIGTNTPILERTALGPLVFAPLARFVDSLSPEVQRVEVEDERSEVFTTTGYRLIVNTYTDFESARRNLSVMLARPEIRERLSHGEVPEYIDLRVPEKIFYKF